MKKVNDIALFKTSYIVFLCLNMIPVINVTIFARFFMLIFAVWAIVLVFYKIKEEKINFFVGPHNSVMIVFFCVCFFSYLINFKNNGWHNIIQLFFYAICVFLLFRNENDEQKVQNSIINLCNGYIVVNLVGAIISNIMYLFQIYFVILGRNGRSVRLGVTENRLFGVYSSPNVGGTFMVLGLIMVFFVYKLSEKRINKPFRILYVLYIINAWIYISMSLSRGTYLTSICVVAFLGLFYIFPKSENIIIGILKKILCCFLIVLVLCAGTLLIQNTMVTVARTVKSITNEINGGDIIGGETDENQNIDIDTDRIESSGDISNKRFSIWKASMNLLKGRTLLGIGDPYTAYLNLGENQEVSQEDRIFLEYSAGNTHNGYIQILVECGVIAFAIYMAYIIYLAVRAFVCLYRIRHKKKCYTVLLVAICVVAYILVNNLVESNMALMGANTFQAVLWVFLGYIVWLIENENKKRVEGDKE